MNLEALVQEQRQRDAALPPFLERRKLLRMLRSPHAFLRGTAKFFYALVRSRKSLDRVKPFTVGWLCGDLHVENFGVFRTNPERARDSERVVFDVNDFDDAVRGPLALDVLRLTTSLLLATRSSVPDAAARRDLALGCLAAYDESFSRGKRLSVEPRFIRQLRERSAKRKGRQLVSERTRGEGNDMRFVRGDRYRTLPPAEKRAAKDAFLSYVDSTLVRGIDAEEARDIVDIAYRVAGTGSLGAYRVAILTRGRRGHAPWLFDMKEERAVPNPGVLLPVPKGDPASRVVAAESALLAALPAGLGIAKLGGRSMLVRRLSPQEDKVSIDELVVTDLAMVLPFLGSVVGEMHRRAVPGKGRAASGLSHAALIDEAAALAGVYETAHLLYFARAR